MPEFYQNPQTSPDSCNSHTKVSLGLIEIEVYRKTVMQTFFSTCAVHYK